VWVVVKTRRERPLVNLFSTIYTAYPAHTHTQQTVHSFSAHSLCMERPSQQPIAFTKIKVNTTTTTTITKAASSAVAAALNTFQIDEDEKERSLCSLTIHSHLLNRIHIHPSTHLQMITISSTNTASQPLHRQQQSQSITTREQAQRSSIQYTACMPTTPSPITRIEKNSINNNDTTQYLCVCEHVCRIVYSRATRVERDLKLLLKVLRGLFVRGLHHELLVDPSHVLLLLQLRQVAGDRQREE
jgi:hypothetical protein